MGLGPGDCLEVLLTVASASLAVKWATLMVARIQGASTQLDWQVIRAQ